MAQKTCQRILLIIILVFPVSVLSQSESPLIHKISPERILEGTQTVVTITGEKFGEPNPKSRTFVSSGDQLSGPGLKIITWTDTRIEGTFPYFLKPGKYNIFIMASGTPSTPFQVEVVAIPAPVIESVDPETGIPDSRIRITGKHLGESGDYRLVLRQFIAGEYRMVENLKISAWYPNEILAHISETTLPGVYVLSLEKGESSIIRKKFAIVKPVPEITKVSPPRIFEGDEPVITLSGRYFGENERDRMVVITEDTVSSKRFLTVRSWSDNSIQVIFPFDQEPRKYYLYVYTPQGGKSNYASLHYLGKPAPKITRLSPWEGIPGLIIYIHGRQFGNGEKYQLILRKITDDPDPEKQILESTAWADDRIDMLLPPDLEPGDYIIGLQDIKTEEILTDFAFRVKSKSR